MDFWFLDAQQPIVFYYYYKSNSVESFRLSLFFAELAGGGVFF